MLIEIFTWTVNVDRIFYRNKKINIHLILKNEILTKMIFGPVVYTPEYVKIKRESWIIYI